MEMSYVTHEMSHVTRTILMSRELSCDVTHSKWNMTRPLLVTGS